MFLTFIIKGCALIGKCVFLLNACITENIWDHQVTGLPAIHHQFNHVKMTLITSLINIKGIHVK